MRMMMAMKRASLIRTKLRDLVTFITGFRTGGSSETSTDEGWRLVVVSSFDKFINDDCAFLLDKLKLHRFLELDFSRGFSRRICDSMPINRRCCTGDRIMLG
ncbi:hypothetical protein LXL04_006645 [Taraxacum kok-saghyz]